jgi:outer membrane lipoprotein SlyB
MDTSPTRSATRPHPLLIAAALAVILFCAVGTAAIMGWLPSSSGGTRGQLSDADRAALAGSLQQPGAAYAPAPATAPLAAAPAGVPQALAAPVPYPAAPAPTGAAHGSNAGQGTSASGDDTRPAQPVREAAREPADEPAPAARVADSDSGGRWCGSCGNVEAVRTITTRARPSGVGAAGGAILGGLLGNQVGGGHGRQLATVAGAVGGAVMGNQVEGNMHVTHSYEIRVRLDDGKLRTFHQQSVPQWRSGDRVRVVKGSLRAA